MNCAHVGVVTVSTTRARAVLCGNNYEGDAHDEAHADASYLYQSLFATEYNEEKKRGLYDIAQT